MSKNTNSVQNKTQMDNIRLKIYIFTVVQEKEIEKLHH